jgi:hypothetical protein
MTEMKQDTKIALEDKPASKYLVSINSTFWEEFMESPYFLHPLVLQNHGI